MVSPECAGTTCSMMRPTRANKPNGYFLGSYSIATAPEPNSSRLTSRKSITFDSPANNVGPWPASRNDACLRPRYCTMIAAPVQCDVDWNTEGVALRKSTADGADQQFSRFRARTTHVTHDDYNLRAANTSTSAHSHRPRGQCEGRTPGDDGSTGSLCAELGKGCAVLSHAPFLVPAPHRPKMYMYLAKEGAEPVRIGNTEVTFTGPFSLAWPFALRTRTPRKQ